MKLRKNAGSKKREKSLGISRFLAVWLAKRLFPSLGSKLTCQYGRAAGYSPAAKIPPPAAGECEPTHLRPAERWTPQPTEKPPRRAAGYSPTAKIPPPAAGKCEPTHLRPAQMPGRTVGPPANRKATPEGWLFCWLGWPDSDRRMRESKSRALPLGDTPKLPFIITRCGRGCQVFFVNCAEAPGKAECSVPGHFPVTPYELPGGRIPISVR